MKLFTRKKSWKQIKDSFEATSGHIKMTFNKKKLVLENVQPEWYALLQ